MKWITLCLIYIGLNQAFAQTCINRGPSVILFTWDGVRPQEFFRGTGWILEKSLPKSERGEVLDSFWKNHAHEGMVLGGNNRYRVGSDVAVSLPSYQSIMAGESTHCRKNNCESIQVETLMESLVKNLGLKKKDVAVFASWNRIMAAAAKNPDNITHGIYPEMFDDGTSDPVMKSIQEKSLKDLPEWSGSRKDKYTFSLAKEYLKKTCPRFLWISLVDSDEFGHAGNYQGYVSSLRTYDTYLDELIRFLDDSGEYGRNTTLFVTTDHSRGAGPFWKGHGITSFTEKNIFLYARGRGVEPSGRVKLKGNHLLLRPTIESLMGIQHSQETLPGINTKQN
jgi:hypothetical protein